MESRSWSGRRIAGYAGVVFAVVFLVGFVLGEPPLYDDPASDFREFFVDQDFQVHLGTWLFSLVLVFFFLPFAAGLRNLLAPEDRADEQMWARLSYTGAVLTTAIGVIGMSFHEVLSQGVAEFLSDDALVALARFDTLIFLGLMPWALALFLAAASIVILRSGVLPKWTGWLGTAGALLSVIGALWIFGENDESALAVAAAIGILVTALWVLAVGFIMTRTSNDAGATELPDLLTRDRI